MESKKYSFMELNGISKEAWNKLANQKIFFGHQSVGNNIMNGINTIITTNRSIPLIIVDTKSIGTNSHGVFAHSKVGQNSDPKSKFNSFSKILENTSNKAIDIAFLKLCFVDIKADTNVKELFSYYKNTISKIKSKYPDLLIVHFTVPITQLRITWKTKLKQIIGRKEIWEYDHVIKKHTYNDLLINEYLDIDPIFDIASIESTYPDGSRNSFTYRDKIYYSLIAEYSSDGAHLNDLGQRIVGESLLFFLVNL